jgi:protein-S-isoprenylcysteine O-methyltransferase Ste14
MRAVGTRSVLYVVRHLLAIVALPVTVAVAIPLWIARRNDTVPAWPSSLPGAVAVAAGIIFLAVGFLLFAASLRRFATEGRGTLAPWDPPRRLVVSGPYRYVRNPMISGVVFTVFGLGLILRSAPHLEWAATFLAINLVYIPLLEEPFLEQRFGRDYDEYRRHVRRFLPRLTPWHPPEGQTPSAGASRTG